MVGLAFSYLYRSLPSSSGAVKGLLFGLCGWLAMNLVAFPILGLGTFAAATGLGIWPALFSLAMLSTYSVVMGMVYATLERRSMPSAPGEG